MTRGEGSVFQRADGYWVGQVEAGRCPGGHKRRNGTVCPGGERRRVRVVRRYKADAVAAMGDLRRRRLTALWDHASAPVGGCHLYRLWGDDGRLLYIGVSRCLRRRLQVHMRRWGGFVTHATWEQLPDVATLMAAEAAAIAHERPPLNVQGVR